MEKLLPYLLLLFRFSSLPLLSSYVFPDKYFINCGSTSDADYGHRTFVGDESSASLATVSGKSEAISASVPSNPSSVYDTARIFRNPSSYDLKLTENGTHIVRLHFNAVSSHDQYDLSQSQFNVSASGYALLSNFNLKNQSPNSPVVKEFFINVPTREFSIVFTPDHRSSSFAFINAIEAFQSPTDSVLGNNITHLVINASGVYEGSSHVGGSLSNNVFRVVYRINVGGSLVTAENDTIGRSWVPDDEYLVIKNSAKNGSFYSSRLNYVEGGADTFSAPEFVYRTAKETNSLNANATWRFNVEKSVRHFVRAHFCDITGRAISFQTQFNFYVYGNYSKFIFPFRNVSFILATPFYFDFLVDSDDSGLIDISIGLRNSSDDQIAFLNGLEIMEMMTDLDLGIKTVGKEKEKINRGLIIGLGLGGFVFVMASVSMVILGGKTVPEGKLNLNLGLRLSFKELKSATSDFSDEFIIGKGGFGNVYKGILKNGTKVAVKRSSHEHGQGISEFQMEILILSKIRHRNLVSLIGYCDEGSEMILVYEFVENGTLREHLQVSESDRQLSWIRRLEICIGAAKGIHYLHSGLGVGIIHRDIKSTNILLDESFNAKVGDFGLSKHGDDPDQTHVTTFHVKGSIGYMDPEYFRFLQLTLKSDVYSFGVVLLEVLCGRAAVDNSLPLEEASLAMWGLDLIKEGRVKEIVDSSIADEVKPISLRKFGETVEKCLREYGVDRPSMGQVLWDLEYALRLQQTEAPDDSVLDISLGITFPTIGSEYV